MNSSARIRSGRFWLTLFGLVASASSLSSAWAGSWWVSPQMGLLQTHENLTPPGPASGHSFQDSALALQARVLYFPNQSSFSFGTDLQLKLVSIYSSRSASYQSVWTTGFLGYDLPTIGEWLETTIKAGASYRGTFLSVRQIGYQDSFGLNSSLLIGTRVFSPVLLSIEPGVRISSRGLEASLATNFDFVSLLLPMRATISWTTHLPSQDAASGSDLAWTQWALLFGAEIY